MGFSYLIAAPVLWFKASTYKYGNQYYTYILVCVDGIIIVDKQPCNFMSVLMEKYTVKPSIIGDTRLYLGADIGKVYCVYQ